MNVNELRLATNKGWNTWNTASVLSYVHLPEGFAINLCITPFDSGITQRESLIGRENIVPGPRTYDGRYVELNMKCCASSLKVCSAVDNDDQIIVVECLESKYRLPELTIEACILWGKDGAVAKKNNVLTGDFDSGKFTIYTNGSVGNCPSTNSLSPSISVALDKKIVIATRPVSVEEAESILAKNKKTLDSENSVYGGHEEAYTAMKTCLAWDTIYESAHDRVCSPVSRLWNMGWGGYVLFDWDTYFASMMASLENRDLAYLNAIAITEEATENGFIPNFGCSYDSKSRDRSQPPVGSHAALEIYKKWQDKWFLEYMFEPMIRWNRWFASNRTTEEGYMCWGSDYYESRYGRYFEVYSVHDLQGAKFESGLDNSPMYDGAEFDEKRNIMLLADVGLMGLYIMDCRCLMEIAGIIGREEVIPEISERKKKVEAALETLWDEDYGFYLNKNLASGELSKRISPTNFYALQSDTVPESRKARIANEHLYNKEEFDGEYIIPSIARNDPAYPDQDYWRGRIWAPMNYLAYISFKHAGMKKECDYIAEKSEKLILKEWRLHGHVHENYSGDDGMGCNVGNSDKFYHWGGLLAYIAIDNDK